MIKKKIKKCSCGCGKEGLIWSKGMLKECYFKHFPSKPLKKGGKIAKYSEKGLIKKEAKKVYLEAQFKLFEQHWNSKPHYCESCGKWLGNENLSIFHDHLIEKSKRIDIALEINNLYLCCADCHSLKTNGFPTEKHKIAIEKAKELYE